MIQGHFCAKSSKTTYLYSISRTYTAYPNVIVRTLLVCYYLAGTQKRGEVQLSDNFVTDYWTYPLFCAPAFGGVPGEELRLARRYVEQDRTGRAHL